MRGATPAGLAGDIGGGFQSTLPMRGATLETAEGLFSGKFQSTLPMRGATGADPYHAGSLGISIHTPHAGSDISLTG